MSKKGKDKERDNSDSKNGNRVKMRLSDLSKGETAIIESFTNEDTKLKLMEMGCLPGEIVKVSRHAPLGCPVAIKISDYTLSLRMEEADTIIVSKYIS